MTASFSELRGLIAARLPTGLTTPIEPGPEVPHEPTGRMVVLTPVAGPGLVTEDLFDVVGWQVRCVGDQNDYADAESLARTVDHALLQRPWPTWTLRVIRSGGGPAPLMTDDARRTHFTANYLFEVQSGLEVSP